MAPLEMLCVGTAAISFVGLVGAVVLLLLN